jgi:glycosyltransferase involved in cell wall biosynthesis
MPLISVITPVYNGEKTIKETIESVLNQTFQDFELIVINDGSQDATVEIVKQVEDSRLKLFSYPNAGQATSRNRGVSQAVGKYIAFLDADDLWTADKLDAQLQTLQANPQAAVAYSWTNCIDESSQFLRRGSYITAIGDVYAKLLLINFLENGSNPLIRAEALAEVGEFDASLTPAEDWDMWLRLAAHYQFVVVPSPQVLYRVSANSSSSNISKLEASCLQVIERAFRDAPESLEHLKNLSLGNLYKYCTFKAIEGRYEQQQGLAAVRYLWHSVRYDPLLLRSRVIWKVLLKIATLVILPPQQAQALLTKFQRLFNTTTLLGYLQSEAL